ncbi:MAG TPA: radical SAM protein [Acidobacteriota bacterium]|nr:radical SAM protein [Acidobacteriota bacterium]
MKCVAVLVNQRCPLSCKHCSIGFSESYRGTGHSISPEEMRRLVYLVDTDVYGIVAMAGGEPSLSPKTLRAGVEACRERGLLSYMVSAPVWGRSAETAQRFLDKVGGINLIILSYDDYHLEFLSFDHYRNAAQEAMKRNIHVVFEICYAQEEEKQRLVDSLDSLGPRALIAPALVNSVGNAEHFDLGQVWVDVQEDADLNRIPRTCQLGNTLLDTEYTVHGCCWAICGDDSPISHPSNGEEASIKQAFKELDANPVYQSMLQARGFIDSLTPQGRKEVMAAVRGERFVTECDLCMRLMRTETKGIWSHCCSNDAVSKAS